MKRAVTAAAAFGYCGALAGLAIWSARALHGTACQDVYFGYQQLQARTSVGLSLPLPVVQMCDSRLLPLLLVALTLVASAGWAVLLVRTPRRAAVGTCAAIGLACAMLFPYVPSTDPYAYALYGYEALHGATPYAASPASASNASHALNALYRLFPPRSSNRVANYGPVAVLQYEAVAFAAGDNLAHFIVLQRVCNAALLALLAWLLSLVRPPGTSRRRAAWIAFHPLLLLESVAFGHGDLLMLVLLCAALAAYRNRSNALCTVLIVLAAEVRLVAALALAVLFIELSRSDVRALVRCMCATGAAFALTAAASIAYYGTFTFGGAPAIEAYSSPAILALDAFGVSMRHVGQGLVLQAAFGLICIAVVLRLRTYRYLPFASLAALPIMRAWYCQWLLPLAALTSDRRAQIAAALCASIAIVAEYPAMTAHSDARTWSIVLALQWLLPAAALLSPELRLKGRFRFARVSPRRQTRAAES